MNKRTLVGILALVLSSQLTISQGRTGSKFKIKTGILVIDTLWTLYGIFNEINDIVNESQNPEPTTSDILSTLNDVARNLDVIGTKLLKKMDSILETMVNRLPEITTIQSDLQRLRDYVRRIDSLYDTFRGFNTNCSDWNPSTLLEFSQEVTDHSPHCVAYTLDSIYSILYLRRALIFPKPLILRIIKNFKDSEVDICDGESSPQQELYDFYTTLLVTELKGFVLISFAYSFRSSFNETTLNSLCNVSLNNTFRQEQRNALTQLQTRVGNYTSVFHGIMRSTSRALRRCDPLNGHTRGNTFHEFERFIHGLIIREQQMRFNDSCRGKCESPNVQRDHSHDDIIGTSNLYVPNSRCEGEIIECESIGSTEICFPPCEDCRGYHFFPRRYEWFIDGNRNKYGNTNEQCGGELLHESRYLRGFAYCDICLCTCVEDGFLSHSTRFVSLRKGVSDTKNNKVITGVKFISADHVIQIQIQEGKLTENGLIESGSASWKAPESISFSHLDTYLAGRTQFNVRTPYPDGQFFRTDDNDVKVFDSSNREIHLDELHVPEDHVMTGIKFDQVGEWPYPAIQLSIRATPFDYGTGKLGNESASIWITPEHMENILAAYKRERTEIKYGHDMKNPINAGLKTTPNFEPNKFIKITKTSLRSDAGQTVIPLLDGLEVAANPPVPLGGVNLFHKSADEYGGFLSFQILSIDRADDKFFVQSDYSE